MSTAFKTIYPIKLLLVLCKYDSNLCVVTDFIDFVKHFKICLSRVLYKLRGLVTYDSVSYIYIYIIDLINLNVELALYYSDSVSNAMIQIK